MVVHVGHSKCMGGIGSGQEFSNIPKANTVPVHVLYLKDQGKYLVTITFHFFEVGKFLLK